MDENASKALLMAAEVLIGVIILSIFAYVFERAYLFAEHYGEISDRQKIIEFNTQFTSYVTNNSDMKYIYAEDVVTIANQAINWNESTPDDNEKITLYIYDQTGVLQVEINDKSDFDGVEFLNDYKLTDSPTNPEYQFSCEVSLQEGTGRVNQVIIRNMGPKT